MHNNIKYNYFRAPLKTFLKRHAVLRPLRQAQGRQAQDISASPNIKEMAGQARHDGNAPSERHVEFNVMLSRIRRNQHPTNRKEIPKHTSAYFDCAQHKLPSVKVRNDDKQIRNDDYQFLNFPLLKNTSLIVMFFVFFILLPLFSNCQNDSLKTDSLKKHSPRLATLMSTFVPGLGQVYNKKYWKVPVIYVGLGTLGYLAYKNNVNYKQFRSAYLEMYKDTSIHSYKMNGMEFTLNGLETGKNYYRRYRDLFVIFTTGLYIMNIIDANVDANLYDFDISDNLSLRIEPTPIFFGMNKTTMGIKINLSF